MSKEQGAQEDFEEPIDDGNGVEVESIDEATELMDKPFDPTQINVETKTPSLDILIKRIKRGAIEMNTESYFQRKDDLWNKTKQSRLIESILIRFPLPAFFFDASDNDKWLVVDGLQRLSSIRNFVLRGQKLVNMEFLTHLNGKTWDDLPFNLQLAIEETTVLAHKIMPGTPVDVKYNIFKRINTGGLALEPQEIRHALFQGQPADFVKELAESAAFLKATGQKIRKERMLDRDFANRFLAFYLFGEDTHGADLDTFMSKAMDALYHKTQEELKAIRVDYDAAMELAWAIFGDKAFRKFYRKKHTRYPPINKALFDVIATQFALLSPNERVVLKASKRAFKVELQKALRADEYFFSAVSSSTGDRKKVKYRHQTLRKLIEIFTIKKDD